MFFLARKNLFEEKVKFAVSLLGVALSLVVIVAPLGVYYGALLPARALPEKSNASFWVVQEGSADLFHTVSLLPAGQESVLNDIPGVRSVSTIISRATQVKIGSASATAAVLGFDEATGIGGPWQLYSGTAALGAGEVIVDRSLAHRFNLKLGDQISIGDHAPFTIAGISLDTNVVVFQYIFMTSREAVRTFTQDASVNYYLLNVDPNTAHADIVSAVTGILPGATVKSSTEIADHNAAVISESFLPIIGLLALIGLFVGATVIGITIYSMTAARAREYGVLKAIGVSGRRLYAIVLTQAMITSLVGFVLGIGLYVGIEQLAFRFFPQVNFSLPFSFYGYAFLLALAMSLVASFVPAAKINALDPADVFKR